MRSEESSWTWFKNSLKRKIKQDSSPLLSVLAFSLKETKCLSTHPPHSLTQTSHFPGGAHGREKNPNTRIYWTHETSTSRSLPSALQTLAPSQESGDQIWNDSTQNQSLMRWGLTRWCSTPLTLIIKTDLKWVTARSCLLISPVLGSSLSLPSLSVLSLDNNLSRINRTTKFITVCMRIPKIVNSQTLLMMV